MHYVHVNMLETIGVLVDVGGRRSKNFPMTGDGSLFVEQVPRRTHEAAGIAMPQTFKLNEPQSLAALSTVLAQVNKRGLW